MDDFIGISVKLIVTYLAALITPGPSIALVISNRFIHSSSASIKSSFGIIVGIALQTGLVLMGISYIDKGSKFFQYSMMLSSLFLIYLGLTFIKVNYSNPSLSTTSSYKQTLTSFFIQGFLVEVLNPMPLCFLFAIITIHISPDSFWYLKLLYWTEIILIGIAWFCGISILISCQKISKIFNHFNNRLKLIRIISGGSFVLLGLVQLYKIIK